MALGVQKGEIPRKKAGKAVRHVADTVKTKSVQDFARKPSGRDRVALAAHGARLRMARKKSR